MTYTAGVISLEAPTLPTIFGRYILLKGLGRGAMGDVHLARPLNRYRGVPELVVLKRLRGELVEKEAFVSRFRHEAAVAVSVDSRHVAKVYDVGSVGSALYIVMEYIAGWTLSDILEAILKSGRHASIASVLDLLAGGLRGVDALHSATDLTSGQPLAAVHRDLSPKNLMVGEDGHLRLIDLGLGKSKLQDWRTQTGVIMGSVGYMPPEQARGERVDHRADIYAFGAVAFEVLALRNYIRRGPVAEMIERALQPAFTPPSEFRPDIPQALDDALRCALAIRPEDRFPSARAFLEALERIVSPAETEGGMRALLEDLFGATRTEREAEVRRLLQVPDPRADEFDTQPTRVFALGAGIEADVPEPQTVATELNHRDPQAFVRRVWPDPASIGPRPLGPSPSGTKVPRMVSVPVLIGAVVAAALFGGLVVTGIMHIGDDTPAPVSATPAAAPTAERAEENDDESSSKKAAPPRVRRGPIPFRDPPKLRSRSEPPAGQSRAGVSVPKTTPEPATMAALDSALDSLAKRVDAQRATAKGGLRRDLTALLVAISQARASQDAARKEASLNRLRGQLRGLNRVP